MSLDRRGVDQHFRRRATGRCQGVEDVHPDAFGRPAHEAVVERLARAVDARCIGPTRTRLQHVNDAADDAPIVSSRLAARIRRKMWRQPSELRVVQPKVIPIHARSPLGDLESRNPQTAKPIYGSGA